MKLYQIDTDPRTEFVIARDGLDSQTDTGLVRVIGWCADTGRAIDVVVDVEGVDEFSETEIQDHPRYYPGSVAPWCRNQPND